MQPVLDAAGKATTRGRESFSAPVLALKNDDGRKRLPTRYGAHRLRSLRPATRNRRLIAFIDARLADEAETEVLEQPVADVVDPAMHGE